MLGQKCVGSKVRDSDKGVECTHLTGHSHPTQSSSVITKIILYGRISHLATKKQNGKKDEYTTGLHQIISTADVMEKSYEQRDNKETTNEMIC